MARIMYCAVVRRIADTFSSRLNISSQFSFLNSQLITRTMPGPGLSNL